MSETEPLHALPNSNADPGLAALVIIAGFHGLAAEAEQLRHAAGGKSTQFNDRDLVLSARSLGLKTRKVRVSADRLAKTPLPALALDKDGQHFILAGCDDKKALILEPGA